MVQENTAEAIPEVAQAEPEKPVTPTIDELTARLAQYEKDLKSARDEAKAHQKFGQEKQVELKNQSDLRGEIASIREDLELAVTAFATRQSSEDAPDNEVVKATLAELAKKRDARESSRRTQEASNILGAYQQRVVALGLTEDDEAYWDIYRTARTLDPADLKIADIKLRKLEAVKTVTSKENKTETVDIQKAIAEGIQAELKKRGLLTSDNNSPGGAMSVSVEKATEDYKDGNITAEEARKRGVIFS